MSFEVNTDYIHQLERDIRGGSFEKHLTTLQEMHPADLAEVLEELDLDVAKMVLEILENEQGADALIELDEDIRKKILQDYSGKEIAHDLVEQLDSDDAADLINELPEQKKREVLRNIEDQAQAQDIANLLVYAENTAGALMGTEMVIVNQNWSVLECVKEMRKQAQHVEQIHSIYVVDDENHLLGTLSLKKLLTTSTRTPISEVYNDKLKSVEASTSGEEVALDMQKYDLVVIPVVDTFGHLIGRITIDDVIDLIREEAKEDYNLASGLTDEVETKDSIMTITRARLPWLLIGLFGGLLAAGVIRQFEGPLAGIPEMAFFIPLIAAMGGNVGVQSSAIIVQGLASKAAMGSLVGRLVKELGVALLNGFICGAVIIVAGLLLGYGTNLSLTVATALIAVIVVSALVGTFVPLILDRYSIDPALATGPFITTMNDILGLFIYFTIGAIILGF